MPEFVNPSSKNYISDFITDHLKYLNDDPKFSDRDYELSDKVILSNISSTSSRSSGFLVSAKRGSEITDKTNKQFQNCTTQSNDNKLTTADDISKSISHKNSSSNSSNKKSVNFNLIGNNVSQVVPNSLKFIDNRNVVSVIYGVNAYGDTDETNPSLTRRSEVPRILTSKISCHESCINSNKEILVDRAVSPIRINTSNLLSKSPSLGTIFNDKYYFTNYDSKSYNKPQKIFSQIHNPDVFSYSPKDKFRIPIKTRKYSEHLLINFHKCLTNIEK